MNNTLVRLVLPAVAMAALAGCANTTTPVLDSHFGDAVRGAVAQQTLNPDASRNTDPVAGIDGRAAKDAMDRYHESFKTPPKTFSVINIGEGVSSGGEGK